MSFKKSVILVIVGLLVLLPTVSAWAEGTKAIAVVLMSKGETEMKKPDQSWSALKFGTVLDGGDKIRTGEKGFIALAFTDDKSQLKIRPNTELTLNAERDEEFNLAKRVNMDIGELFADVKRQKGSLQLVTPTSVASVKGTEFWLLVQTDGQTQLLAIEGIIEFINTLSGQVLDVTAGTFAISNPDGTIDVGELESIDLPEFLEETFGVKSIEIHFQDDEANRKSLIINYTTEEPDTTSGQ